MRMNICYFVMFVKKYKIIKYCSLFFFFFEMIYKTKFMYNPKKNQSLMNSIKCLQTSDKL